MEIMYAPRYKSMGLSQNDFSQEIFFSQKNFKIHPKIAIPNPIWEPAMEKGEKKTKRMSPVLKRFWGLN